MSNNYERLRAAVSKRGLSFRKLAIMTGIAPQSLSAALNGRVEFWPGWRKRIAAALELSEEELFGEEGCEHD